MALATPIPNPFPQYGYKPIFQNSDDFYEFTDLLHEIKTCLKDKISISLVGESKAGKTSFLYNLPTQLPPNIIPIYINLVGILPPQDKIFLEYLIKTAEKEINNRITNLQLSTTDWKNVKSQDIYETFHSNMERLEKTLIQNSITLVWLIDNIDLLLNFKYDDTDTNLFILLHGETQRNTNTQWVIAGKDISSSIKNEFRSFFNTFHRLQLEGLSFIIAQQMINDAIKKMDVTIQHGLSDQILTWTARKPFFLKWLMSQIANIPNIKQVCVIDTNIVEQAKISFLSNLNNHFDSWWKNHVTPRQQTILSLIASKSTPYDAKTIFSELQNKNKVTGYNSASVIDDLTCLHQLGFLYEHNGTYSFSSGCVKDWIHQKHPL